MDKKLQDLAWRVLPKEFKEEVNEIYLNAVEHHPCGYNHKTDLLKYLFGYHNLASDAEGEEELLTVQRSKVIDIFTQNTILLSEGHSEYLSGYYNGKCHVLKDLFGSKCLPDGSNEDKHAKPETKECKAGEKILTCNKESVCKFYAHLLDMVENERMSEHYPEWCDLESEYIALFGEMVFIEYFGTKNPSDDEPNPAELSAAHPDRLHIATQLLAGLLASGKEKHPVSRAVALADALIAECEKGDAE